MIKLPVLSNHASPPPSRSPSASAAPEGHVQGEGGSGDFEREDAAPFKRRAFLQVMGTVLAMGAGCTKQPEERIIPFVRAPEDVVAGRPIYYASAALMGGVATGVIVEQNDGRPSKVDGSPEHPMSLGGSDVFIQGSTFDLYDPDRSKTLLSRGQTAGWRELSSELSKAALEHKSRQGEGLAILTGAVTSPTLEAQLRDLQKQMPKAKWHWYEAVPRTAARAGAALAFESPAPGTPADARAPGAAQAAGPDQTATLLPVPHYDLAKADVVVSLDADLFAGSEGHLRHARDFASRRGSETPQPSRLYVFEPTPSITGARADHRWAVRARDVEVVARALAARLGVPDVDGGATLPAALPAAHLAAMIKDLRRAGTKALVVAGDQQPPAVHALAQAINATLGAVGTTVVYRKPVIAGAPDPLASLKELCNDLGAGKVQTLLLVGVNPVYDAPADFGFTELLGKAKLAVHLGLHDDETAGRCQWHVPAAHWLESWSDGRAWDGTVSIVQPLIAPLYGGRTAHELLAALSDRPDRTSYELVRERFFREAAPTPVAPPVAAAKAGEPGGAAAVAPPAAAAAAAAAAPSAGEREWRRALHEGIAAAAPAPVEGLTNRSLRGLPAQGADAGGLEIVFRPDPSVHDGRFANNAWLQEAPRPLTKLTWDNAAFVSTADAKQLGLETGDVVVLELEGRSVEAPVWVLPGQAPGSVAVHLGYGRTRGGKIGLGVGFSAYKLRSSTAFWHASGLKVTKTAKRHEFAITQGHNRMEGRDLIRTQKYGEAPAEHESHPHSSLYPPKEYPKHAWAMAIDLATCIGCNACVVACHAENNVPVVGKEQVLAGREMQWLRIDAYLEGPDENPQTSFQPIPCQQCENAPCETVCPVTATVHSDEGLNDMVYNRCVGTKYCSNNCPYKVRRYNFFGYSVDDVFGLDMKAASVRLMHNPDVTVRSYGVMEKCTYCVQRINFGRLAAKKEDRKVRDGEVQTACQTACPTRAITFGDKNDAQSEVSARRAEPRNYALLAELNTNPRTTYLASLRNPNPEIAG